MPSKLIARPPIIPSTYKTLNSNRHDKLNIFPSPNSKHYRYQLTIIDDDINDTSSNKKSSVVFYIPNGRESEYLFNTKKGLHTILQSANTHRLIAVSFHRNEIYDDLQSCQDELENIVQLVAYRSKNDGDGKIPFTALDEDINKCRNVIKHGVSDGTGDYVIEEIKNEDDVLRRLYFLSNDLLIQTEVKMINDIVDGYYLGFEYHKQITAGIIQFIVSKQQEPLQGLVIGVGGGSLLTFLYNFIPNMKLTGVEIDVDILDIARSYFGLPADDDRLCIHIGNGLFITHEMTVKEAFYNIIIIDVDSKDNTVGMSCPPIDFISIEYLQTIKQLLVSSASTNGVLAVNVCARDIELKQLVIKNLFTVFDKVYVSKSNLDDELNIVLFATSCESGDIEEEQFDRVKALHNYCNTVKNNTSSSTLNSLVTDLEEIIVSIEEINYVEETEKLAGKVNSKLKRKQKSKKKKGKR